jgi:hypothetical protein
MRLGFYVAPCRCAVAMSPIVVREAFMSSPFRSLIRYGSHGNLVRIGAGKKRNVVTPQRFHDGYFPFECPPEERMQRLTDEMLGRIERRIREGGARTRIEMVFLLEIRGCIPPL